MPDKDRFPVVMALNVSKGARNEAQAVSNGANAHANLRALRDETGAEGLWGAPGGSGGVPAEEILRSGVHGGGVRRTGVNGDPSEFSSLAQPEGEGDGAMRTLWGRAGDGRSPQGQEPVEQHPGEPGAAVPGVPYEGASGQGVQPERLHGEAQGARVLQSPPAPVPQARPRRLTPLECERLQGWPDQWTATGCREDGTPYALPDSARYRLVGNGVGSPCTRWIGEALAAAMTQAGAA